MGAPSCLKQKVCRAASLIAAVFFFAAAPAFSDGHAPALGAGTTVTAPAMPGRLLASNCFQCHGTGGVGGFDRIRGSDAAEVRDYLRKSARSDIMAAHAQGYTSAQLDAIIAYLKQ